LIFKPFVLFLLIFDLFFIIFAIIQLFNYSRLKNLSCTAFTSCHTRRLFAKPKNYKSVKSRRIFLPAVFNNLRIIYIISKFFVIILTNFAKNKSIQY